MEKTRFQPSCIGVFTIACLLMSGLAPLGYEPPSVFAASPEPGGYALRFDGSSQHVTFGSATELGATSFTLETWFRREGAGVGTTSGHFGLTDAIPLVTKGYTEDDGGNLDMNYFLGIDPATAVLAADFEERGTSSEQALNHPVLGVTTSDAPAANHILSTSTTGSGSIALDPPGGVYLAGTSVTLTAVPAIGWAFSGWSDDLSGATNPTAIVMSEDRSVGAAFTQNSYTVTVDAVGSGSVSRSPEQATYLHGDEVQLMANPAAGWSFTGWSGHLAGSTNPVSITVDANKTITSTFSQNTYRVTVHVVGGGAVSCSPDQATYLYGDAVQLSASPAAGWSFTGWSGDLAGSANPAVITMDANKTVTATFSQNDYTVAVDVVGSGTVNRNPNQPTYHYSDTVGLLASPSAGWTFVGWFGDLIGPTNPVSVTVDTNKTVTATFSQNSYTVTVDVVGSGSVSRNPDQDKYRYGDVIELTVNPSAGWSFAAWTGNLTGTSTPVSITVDANKTVAATFSQNSYNVTVDVVGGGSVSRSPNQATYLYGDVVQLTAIPGAGWSFTDWSGDLTGSANPAGITVDSNRTVTATFGQNNYTVTVNVVGSGLVSRSPNQATYHYGDAVQLASTPSPGWTFSAWSGGLTGSTNPADLTVDANETVTATFSQNEYAVAVNVVGSGSIGWSPIQATYHYGDGVRFTATPAAGWTFSGWAGDLTGSTNPTDLTIDANEAVTATFSQNSYIVTANVIGSGSVSRNPNQATYVYGDVVQLTAAPTAGWSFAGWSGSVSGAANPANLTVDANETAVATFTQNEYTVAVNVLGSGSVALNPNQATYHYGNVVQLTAIPVGGGRFTGWIGDLAGATNPASLVVNGNKTVTASFSSSLTLGTVTVVKQVQGDNSALFSFAGGLGSFTLSDDGNPVNSTRTFSGLQPGMYTVTELGKPDWKLADISISDPTNDSTSSTSFRSVDIRVRAGEQVVVTFNNVRGWTILLPNISDRF